MKELLKNNTVSQTVYVESNKIKSLKILDTTETTVRVYRDGFLGIAGQKGKADTDALETEAQKNLGLIKYPEIPCESAEINRDETKNLFEEGEFIEVMKEIVSEVSASAPRFLFSNEISYRKASYEYSCDNGRKLRHVCEYTDGMLVIKDKDSSNLYDSVYNFYSDKFDRSAVENDIKLFYDAFYRKAKLPKGKVKVLVDFYTVAGRFFPRLTAPSYFSGTSIFSGKVGKKIFSQNCNISVCRNALPGMSFFDAEGVAPESVDSNIFNNGVLNKLIVNKKDAAEYNSELTGSASAGFDTAPAADDAGLIIEPTGTTAGLLSGDKAIYVLIASGGDITPAGDFASPVQLALLFDKGEIVGRLPDFDIYGNVFDIFGADFVGAASDGVNKFGKEMNIVSHMNVSE